MIILRSIKSSPNRHKSGPVTRFHKPYYPIAAFEREIEVVEEFDSDASLQLNYLSNGSDLQCYFDSLRFIER